MFASTRNLFPPSHPILLRRASSHSSASCFAQGPLAQLKNLKDEIANFSLLFAKKKAKAYKLAAAGKNKLLHIDKVKLVQLDRKFYYEMHHEFDLYESLRFGRFCYNTPEKAEQIAKDQRDVEAREAEELRKTQETAVLFLQALARGKKAREYAKLLKMQQMAAATKRDTRSRGSSRGSRGSTRVRVPSCPPSAPVDPNLPQSPWDLFCTWCAGGDPHDTFPKEQKKSSTMDYKEWVAMLRHLAIFPKQVSKQKSLEIFKQANRGAAGGMVLWKIISVFIFFGCSHITNTLAHYSQKTFSHS